MKRLYKLFLLLALVPVSCSKDLDVAPISSITSSSFFKSENDATGALYGMYLKLVQESNAGNLYFLGEGRSDIMTSSIGGTLGYDRYFEQSLSPSVPGPNWRGLYSIINAANLILKYVPDIAFTSEAQKNDILAQAHTMRAFVYFVLVRSWGDVPMRIEPTEGYDPTTIQLPKTPKAEIFQLIKDDIDQALQLFPDNKFPGGRNIWSMPAANALKADVYLWTGKQLGGGDADFNTALTAIGEIESSDVGLLANYSDIFDYEHKGNKEVIMALRSQLLENGNTYFANMYLQTTNIPVTASQGARDTIGVGGGQNIWGPRDEIRAQFTADDQRKAGTFFELYSSTGYFCSLGMKGRGTVSGGLRMFVDDVILYRYADILLLKAEAKNALGQDPSEEMNKVRERAYGANFASHVFVSGSKAENDDAILKERLLELMYEGKRWWDLLRFHKALELVPLLVGKSPDLLLFPIGNDVLSLEPMVTQNPGWE